MEIKLDRDWLMFLLYRIEDVSFSVKKSIQHFFWLDTKKRLMDILWWNIEW